MTRNHQFKNIYYVWSAYRGPLPIKVRTTDDVCSYKCIWSSGHTYIVYDNKKYLFTWEGYLVNDTQTGWEWLCEEEIIKIEKLVAKCVRG